ncbi:sulfur carrier protein ThiS [Lacrimispora sp. NSJ-141]|uniref:Sulfur carrier protein ThiS n=1 Tax=Lientehia hominis TaxID=2897778 RepID=A0AAP2RI40_9FIRM|nr:sulfur carrier protein ThiS [Lientehia hominis]
MIIINGEFADQAEGKSLSSYLSESGYKQEKVAVERNGKIVPKSEYDDTVLRDNDEVEIVSFVGGG